MRALLLSILHPPGFYLTPRLFIPTTLWSQGGAKLEKLPQKTSVLLTLGAALEELQRHSDERERERRGGWAQEGADSEEHWQRALVNWERVCEGVRESTRGKGGFAGIQQPGQGKTGGGGIGWGRLGKQWDKVTGGKNLDSPAAYVQSLTKVFQAAPVIENHLRALLTPNAPSSSGPLPQYDHLSPSQRAALDRRLRISSEFFATAVVPFVVRDLGLLMEKYLKKGEKWLME
ncbi:hypothetical protein DACRYDRAFT_80582 [Dacryopinax primogenitus]|uniref:Uncharacterized protein n=1 Tax=Dacryopinax primogenitus (strain DJM 731) TaxID=1858805 RepID=M5FYX6_DACPD|nr:uncharacterized protein DACRYDRAFT_80582 [Dacryopinax primogenitus]EJU01105.1 hypothetical protein DACRYDRAFT_80582 [Dacryopinax primogenitus]